MSKTFGKIAQLGYVVKDIEESIEYWTKTLGIGPFLILKDIKFSDYHYRGEACEAPTLTIALANSGDLQIELIQQHDDQPSVYKDFSDQGREGLQHFSSWVTTAEMASSKAEFAAAGYVPVMEGSIPEMGGLFVYYDTQDGPGGSMFEVSNLRDESFTGFIGAIQQSAADWDGQHSILDLTVGE